MRTLLEAIAIALLLSMTVGCMTIDPEAQRIVADRSVNFTAWGIYCVNQVCGIGYVQYQRNPIENLVPAHPIMPGGVIPLRP
jgi:hypothetical protein